MRNDRQLFMKAFSSLANRVRPPGGVLQGSLLSLMHTSSVNKIPAEHIALAQQILIEREELLDCPVPLDDSRWRRIWFLQRQLVQDHLRMRGEYYGLDQVAPLPDAADLAAERRDVFIVVKFMDEEPHIDATMFSILSQSMALSRVVLLMVDNNSTDRSAEVVQQRIERNMTAPRIYYLNQAVPGGGSAARLGTDRALATVLRMSEIDEDWSRLQRATMAVSDGDTVYETGVLKEIDRLMAAQDGVDGVMPFLIYKLTAALRFFREYSELDARFDADALNGVAVKDVNFTLASMSAYSRLPRRERTSGECSAAPSGAYTLLRDAEGNRAKLFPDGQLLLEKLPVSGDDRALIYLEKSYIGADEKWKWHALIGHDLFLRHLFTDCGFIEDGVLPDTSDALKTFRCWSYAIGGQHQLSKPGLKIVTGTDYQSGRVLQAVGCRVVLGDARHYAETETDRLAKMIRNFHLTKNIFYGDVRAAAIERASGLYLHMTRIQDQVETEIRAYPDAFYEHIVFPEGIVFPLRWIIKNTLVFMALSDQDDRASLMRQVFRQITGSENVEHMLEEILGRDALSILAAMEHEVRDNAAERMAEQIIVACHHQIMHFYVATLTSYFATQGAPEDLYGWLLKGVERCECALNRKVEPIHLAQAWGGSEFVIDEQRGQVTKLVSLPENER
ncbi:MAG: hypothetical protein CPSOU_6532 [uncultured Paraburkholderia sp.]|nr:MAG: hypothetical protein CPSOU_6532 [uncultured Paraburkholderia sp.]